MIKNLLVIALRNFKKDKWFSILNVLGLTIGITFSLFLIFYVKDELSYDKSNLKADRICRIVSYAHEPEKLLKFAYTQFPLGPVLKKDFPEVEDAVRFVGKERTLFRNGNNSFYETKIYYVDSTIFNIFTYNFIEGNGAHALVMPNTVVITRSIADRYFGSPAKAIGNTLRTVYNDLYKVTGVIEDVPQNSHIRFDILISASTLPKDFQDNWGGFNNYTYVLLKPATTANSLQKHLQPMYDKYMAVIFGPSHIKIHYEVQPIASIHLHSDLQGEPEELGSMSYIWILGAVAFFMLLIACINYMNLTTARSARRAKEIGIRKVTGSSKQQLIAQFLSESLLTSFFSLLLSVGLTILLLPYFNSISGKAFTIQTIFQPFNIVLLLCILFFTGFVGGSYPAFYLSNFQPVSILKGVLSKASGNVNLRRTLVVFQFSISMIMLICTWIVYSQLAYLRKRDLGFNKDQVMTVTVNTGKDERSKISAMNNEFRDQPGIKSVATGFSYPGSQNINLNLFSVPSKNGTIDKGVECYSIDEQFLQTLGITLAKGRNFSGLPDTLHSVLVNEAMVRDFGWDNAIGKRIKFPNDTSGNYLEVVGVVKDFNQKSLYNPIAPLILFYSPNCNIIQLKINPSNTNATIAKAENVWKKYFPDLPFEYKFLDADFNSQYAADERRGKIFASFSLLTIIITCLGLLGLTAFTTQQKQKEISMRRVMGASIAQVVAIITKNYFWLALIAATIAFPIAYYFMNKWLQVFPYNPGLSVLPFIISAVLILIAALVTATYHSVKAALTKPAKILKTE
ncbi:MAG TPA: ABC transporter permease [Puia sp.]|nr:ABC transporter permease [Puia sp.]